MSEDQTSGPMGTEAREATLPDGTQMTMIVKLGLAQDEVDLLAARIWQETPDR